MVKQQHLAIFSSNLQTMRHIYTRYSSVEVNSDALGVNFGQGLQTYYADKQVFDASWYLGETSSGKKKTGGEGGRHST